MAAQGARMGKRLSAGKSGTRGTAAAGRGGALTWLQGMLCGIGAVVAPWTAALIAALLLPALICLMCERGERRPRTQAMLLLGLAVSIRSIRAGLTDGSGGSVFGVAEPEQVALSWSACGAGWLLAELLPLFANLFRSMRDLAEQAKLSAERDALIAIWGFDPGSEIGPYAPVDIIATDVD